jgi:methionine aminopeptidase
MRKVCRLAREVLDIAAREAKPGVTTDYIDKVVHDACVKRNVCCRNLSNSNIADLTHRSHTHPL